MARDTLIFALEGEVALEDFATAIGKLNSLLGQLAKEVTKDAEVTWIIDELYAGSAVASFRGVNDDASAVEKLVDAYEEIGDSLQSGREVPFSATVQRHARELVGVLNGRVTSIRFETPRQKLLKARPFSARSLSVLK